MSLPAETKEADAPAGLQTQTASGATGCIDITELMGRCMGNYSFAKRLLAKFQGRLEADIAELENRISEGDTEGLARLAHRIKGAAANVAAHRLTQEAATIKECAVQNRIAEIAYHLQELRKEQKRIEAAAPHLAWELEGGA